MQVQPHRMLPSVLVATKRYSKVSNMQEDRYRWLRSKQLARVITRKRVFAAPAISALPCRLPHLLLASGRAASHLSCCCFDFACLFLESVVKACLSSAPVYISMDAQDKQFLWTIILQVHPDKLTNHPLEQLQNTESLKAGYPVSN